MRKFNDILKEKQNKALEVNESKVLNDFQQVYNALLEKYKVVSFDTLNEGYQNLFAKEINKFWDESTGLTEKGQQFLKLRSAFLHEDSSPLQKKLYLKKKALPIINETLRQGNIKYKLYDIIDEMYNSIGASSLSDVLTTKTILNTIQECLMESTKEILDDMSKELNESI